MRSPPLKLNVVLESKPPKSRILVMLMSIVNFTEVLSQQILAGIILVVTRRVQSGFAP